MDQIIIYARLPLILQAIGYFFYFYPEVRGEKQSVYRIPKTHYYGKT